MSQDNCDPAIPQILSPCATLDQAIRAVQDAASGESLKSMNLRDRSTTFQDSSLEARRKYLLSLITNRMFACCPNYQLATAIAGMPQGRGPGVLRRTQRLDPCGCPGDADE